MLTWAVVETWESKGEQSGAVENYEQRGHALDPNHAHAYSRGNAWIGFGNAPDKAIEENTQAIRFDPKLVAAYNGRGEAWETKGRCDKALANFNEALQLNRIAQGSLQ